MDLSATERAERGSVGDNIATDFGSVGYVELWTYKDADLSCI